jgi:protein TonB
VGGVVGGVVGGQLGSNGTTVIPFGAGMELPRLLVKTEPVYSREAAAMHVSGIALVKCIINLDGSLTDCRIVKGLPYMDQAILESLRTWKYTPVMYQGHPQRVEKTLQSHVVPSG